MADTDQTNAELGTGVNPDTSGIHNLAEVTGWASRHVSVPDRDALRVVEALARDGRGRLIVLRGPRRQVGFPSLIMELGEEEAEAPDADDNKGGVWGPIGCILPLNENVDGAVVALVTGHIYVVRPDEDDEGNADPAFRQMTYPNATPIDVTAHDIPAAEETFMQYMLPHDETRLLSSGDPAQAEEVSRAIAGALHVIKTVNFAALRADSMRAASSQFFGGLGSLLGVEGEPE